MCWHNHRQQRNIPIMRHIRLMACLLSRKSSKNEAHLQWVQTLFWPPGNQRMRSNIDHILTRTQFCDSRWDINPLNPTVIMIRNFLSESFHRGMGYKCWHSEGGQLLARKSCGRLQSRKPLTRQQVEENGIQPQTIKTPAYWDLGYQASAAETEDHGPFT